MLFRSIAVRSPYSPAADGIYEIYISARSHPPSLTYNNINDDNDNRRNLPPNSIRLGGDSGISRSPGVLLLSQSYTHHCPHQPTQLEYRLYLCQCINLLLPPIKIIPVLSTAFLSCFYPPYPCHLFDLYTSSSSITSIGTRR